MWLWWSRVDACPADIDPRLDLPEDPHPQQADRWTWLVLAYTQLRLARPIAADRHRPWEKPAAPDRSRTDANPAPPTKPKSINPRPRRTG
jgi:hypothetical protein